MTNNDIDLQLLYGMPIKSDNGIYVHSPKLKTIVEIGESSYQELLSILLLDKESFGIETEELNNVDIFEIYYNFCKLDSNFYSSFSKAIALFMREEIFIGDNGEIPLFYFGKIEDGKWITQFNFDYIQEMIRKVNFIKKQEKETFNPANEIAKEFIKQLEEIEANRPKPKEMMNLMSIINGLAWRPNDVNIFNVFDLTLFQLYNGFFSTENIDNYQFTVNALYAGTIDSKKIDVKKIHWAKKIEK